MDCEEISRVYLWLQLVVERLVTFMEDDDIRMISAEEMKVFVRMSAVFHSDEWVEILLFSLVNFYLKLISKSFKMYVKVTLL